MRGRYPGPSGISYSFGPGPLTPAIKAIIIANGLVFIVTFFQPDPPDSSSAVSPQYVVEQFAVWELVTYMFVHGGAGHLLFNMLTLYLMGVELERMWGPKFFAKFYFACGIGAGVTQVLLGLLPGSIGNQFYYTSTIGASGAIFGVLLAYALYFPDRPILMFFLFPVPAKYFVMILGALALLFAAGGRRRSGAHRAPRRTRDRLPVSQAPSSQPLRRDSVPVSQVAHQSHATQVRCLFRRPPRRHQPAGPLAMSTTR